MVRMFAQRPWQRDLPKWYPPITQYNTILLRLRRLGLYTDEHLVSSGTQINVQFLDLIQEESANFKDLGSRFLWFCFRVS